MSARAKLATLFLLGALAGQAESFARLKLTSVPSRHPARIFISTAMNPFQTGGNAPITIFGVSPSLITAGSGNTAIAISGTNLLGNFGSSCATVTVLWNNTSITPSSPATSTLVQATVPGSLLATPGTATVQIQITNSPGITGCNKQTSNTYTETIVANPFISSVSPNQIPAGAGNTTLSIVGTTLTGGFPVESCGTPTVAVTWTQQSINTLTIVGSPTPTNIAALVPSTLLTIAGTAYVQVVITYPNFTGSELRTGRPRISCGTQTSNSYPVTITTAAPTLNSISPTSATACGPAFTLSLQGSNFQNNTAVGFGLNPNALNQLTPTNETSTALQVTVPTADFLTAGAATVAAANPTLNGYAFSNSLNFTINPTPAVTKIISPSSALAVGSAGFQLTLTVANYIPGVTQVRWGSSSLLPVVTAPSQPTSSAQVVLQVAGSLLTAPGPVLLTAVNTDAANPNGAAYSTTCSPPVTFTIAGPTISSLNPSSAIVGGPAFNLTITGTSFASGATVKWTPSSGQATTLTPASGNVTSTQIVVNVPANLIATVGTVQVSVTEGGVNSNNAPFTITTPAPTITSLNPSTQPAGSPAFNLTITGTNFASGATVTWTSASGQATTLTPSSISSTQIVVPIAAILVATAGTAQVTVTVGTAVSTSASFTISQPVPTITSLNPATAAAGSPAFNLTITGTNFASGATVTWTSAAGQATTLTPSSISSTQIVVSIPANLVATAGTAQVAVQVGTAVSGSAAFSIGQAAITNLAPSSATAGSGAFNLTITGTNFASGATVTWTSSSGQATTLTPTSVSATQIVVNVSANLIASPGTAQVAVNVGSVASGAVQFTISAYTPPTLSLALSSPPANVTVQPTLQLTVNSAPTQALAGTLTLSFTPNAANLPSSYIDPAAVFAANSSTSLNFTIPAGSTTVSLPNNGMFSQGTVAGTLTITMTSLTAGGNSVLPSLRPSTTVTVAPSAPVVTSASIINLTSSGFTVDVQGFSTPRDLNSAAFTFSAASGDQISGTTAFTVSNLTSAAAAWFQSGTPSAPGGLQNGSRFDMQVPFTFTGSNVAVGSVSVTLTNSAGTSTAVPSH